MEEKLIFIIFSSIFFVIIGSYFSVITLRGLKDSIYLPSNCDGCQRKLNWWELLPIVSGIWIILRHKSKTYCCEQIYSYKYVVTEIYSAIFGALVGLLLFNNISNIFLLILFVITALLLLYLSIEDIWHFGISLLPTIFLGILWLVLRVYANNQLSAISSLENVWVSALILFLIIFLVIITIIILSRGKGLGFGDILLFLFITSSLSTVGTFINIQITIYLASFVGIIGLILSKFKRGLIVPLVPFLSLSWLITIIFYDQILDFTKLLGFF